LELLHVARQKGTVDYKLPCCYMWMQQWYAETSLLSYRWARLQDAEIIYSSQQHIHHGSNSSSII